MSHFVAPVPPGGSGYPTVTVSVTHRPCSTVHVVLAWVFAALTLGVLLPWAIAATRGHKDVVAIALINWLLPWTFIAWVICLVWSLSSPDPRVTMTATTGYAQPYVQPGTQPWDARSAYGVGPSDWQATRPLPPATPAWPAPHSAPSMPHTAQTMPLPPHDPAATRWDDRQDPRG